MGIKTFLFILEVQRKGDLFRIVKEGFTGNMDVERERGGKGHCYYVG